MNSARARIPTNRRHIRLSNSLRHLRNSQMKATGGWSHTDKHLINYDGSDQAGSFPAAGSGGKANAIAERQGMEAEEDARLS
jgi:hypothetical protein